MCLIILIFSISSERNDHLTAFAFVALFRDWSVRREGGGDRAKRGWAISF